MRETIYLISDRDGAASTNSEAAARALEGVGAGFRRCSREEWVKKRRQQVAAERAESARENRKER